VEIGFVGLGWIGLPMARRIESSEHSLHVWARSSASIEPFANGPALTEISLAALGESCEIVGVCVRDDAAVEDVLVTRGLLAAMRPGGVIVIHSTVHPDTCRRLAKAGDARGVMVIDAPVSGGPWAAEAGELAVMVGADPKTFERCLPMLKTFGGFVRLIGPVGAGQSAKLINNLLTTATVGLLFEIFELCDGLGLDHQAIQETLTAGSADSRMLRIHPDLSQERARQGAPLLRKDVAIISELVESRGLRVSALETASKKAVESMTALGEGDRHM